MDKVNNLVTPEAIAITVLAFFIVEILRHTIGLRGKWILPIVILIGALMGIGMAAYTKTSLLMGAFTGIYSGGFATYLKNILEAFWPNLNLELEGESQPTTKGAKNVKS